MPPKRYIPWYILCIKIGIKHGKSRAKINPTNNTLNRDLKTFLSFITTCFDLITIFFPALTASRVSYLFFSLHLAFKSARLCRVTQLFCPLYSVYHALAACTQRSLALRRVLPFAKPADVRSPAGLSTFAKPASRHLCNSIILKITKSKTYFAKYKSLNFLP